MYSPDRYTSDRLLTFIKLTVKKDDKGIYSISQEQYKQIADVFWGYALSSTREALKVHNERRLAYNLQRKLEESNPQEALHHKENWRSSGVSTWWAYSIFCTLIGFDNNYNDAGILYDLKQAKSRYGSYLSKLGAKQLNKNDIKNIQSLFSSGVISSKILIQSNELLRVTTLKWFWSFGWLTLTGETRLANSGWYVEKYLKAFDEITIREKPSILWSWLDDQIKITVDGLTLMSKERFYELVQQFAAAFFEKAASWIDLSSLNFSDIIDKEAERIKRTSFEVDQKEDLYPVKNKYLKKILVLLSLMSCRDFHIPIAQLPPMPPKPNLPDGKHHNWYIISIGMSDWIPVIFRNFYAIKSSDLTTPTYTTYHIPHLVDMGQPK